MLYRDWGNQDIMIKQKPSMRIGRITRDGEDIFVGILRKYKESKILDAYEDIRTANEAHGTDLRLIRLETARLMLLSQDYSQFFIDCSTFPRDLFNAHEK